MEKMPNVSVIMPTYNHQETVGEAIQSVLNQTYRDFELIVVDDASTDRTPEILDDFRGDSRLVIHRRESNSACPALICNEAVRNLARGEWISFQFDDDLWFRWGLESLVNRSEGADFIYGHSFYIDYRCKRLKEILGRVLIDRENIMTGNKLANNAVLMKRSVFLEQEGFDEAPLLRRVCDWELWIRLVYRGYRIRQIPEIVSISFLYNNNSLSTLYEYDVPAVLAYIQEKLRDKARRR